jgi:hypothetical protein
MVPQTNVGVQLLGEDVFDPLKEGHRDGAPNAAAIQGEQTLSSFAEQMPVTRQQWGSRLVHFRIIPRVYSRRVNLFQKQKSDHNTQQTNAMKNESNLNGARAYQHEH